MGQKLTERTETTSQSEGYVHIVIGGQSYKTSRTNLIKPVQDAVDAIRSTQEITSVNLSIGNNNIDTGQSSNRPQIIQVKDPNNDYKDLTKDLNIGTTSSGNYYIKINTPVAYTGLTIYWI